MTITENDVGNTDEPKPKKHKFLKVVFGIALIITLLYSCSKRIVNNKAINTVRNDEFDNGITIGKVVKTVCTDSKWKCQTTKTGQVYVIYTGKLEKKELNMQFMIRSIAGETQYILVSTEFDGKKATRAEYGDLDETLLTLYKLYLKKK